MNEFNYRGDDLYCEDVPVQKIVSDMGTPLYIYSRKTLENHFRAFDAAFTATPHITCYSVKANSNLSVLKIFADMGAGVDATGIQEAQTIPGDNAKGIGVAHDEVQDVAVGLHDSFGPARGPGSIQNPGRSLGWGG